MKQVGVALYFDYIWHCVYIQVLDVIPTSSKFHCCVGDASRCMLGPMGLFTEKHPPILTYYEYRAPKSEEPQKKWYTPTLRRMRPEKQPITVDA